MRCSRASFSRSESGVFSPLPDAASSIAAGAGACRHAIKRAQICSRASLMVRIASKNCCWVRSDRALSASANSSSSRTSSSSSRKPAARPIMMSRHRVSGAADGGASLEGWSTTLALMESFPSGLRRERSDHQNQARADGSSDCRTRHYIGCRTRSTGSSNRRANTVCRSDFHSETSGMFPGMRRSRGSVV